MSRTSITDLMVNIRNILRKEHITERQSGLSIRQIVLKTKSQWRTVEKALETLKKLEVVVEEKNAYTDRVERLFSLKELSRTPKLS